MAIGIFDSGLGGLSLLRRAKKTLPDADFIYYADEAHVPYGECTAEQIRGYLGEVFGFFRRKDVSCVIIACNTATSAATRQFRESFPFPVIGMEPAVKPAVEWAADSERKTVLVAATPVTVAGAKLQELIGRVDTGHTVKCAAMPGLVRLAESCDFTTGAAERYIRKALEGFDTDSIGTVVLGCTHFNYFKDSFAAAIGHSVQFIDGNSGTVRRLTELVSARDLAGNGITEYYVSALPAGEEDMVRIERCFDRLDQMENYSCI